MKTRKTISIVLAAFLFTGIAAADTPDIPSPGITPESPFYALEKASERLELAVAQAPVVGSEELEAKVRANHAAETLAEARAMAEKNNTEQVERLMNRYSENMNRSIESASATNKTELKERLRNITNNQNNALAELEDKVPVQAKKGIQKAMENNRKNQAKLGNAPDSLPAEGPDSRAPENPRTDNPSTGESAPITGRSTSPREPATETPNENDRTNRDSPAQSSQDSQSKETSSDRDHENIPNETGSGGRP